MKATLYDYPNSKVYDVTELFDKNLPKKIYGILRNHERVKEIISDINTTERIVYYDQRLSTTNASIFLPGYAARIMVSGGNVVIDRIVVNGIKLLNKRKIKTYLIDNDIPADAADDIALLLLNIVEYSSKEKEKVFEEILTELSKVV